jgi:hypothetical protein
MFRLPIAGAFAVLLALSAGAQAAVCKAPIEVTGHGQNVEKSLPDFGDAYAKRQARNMWRAAVIKADGLAFANLAKARNVTWTPDAGAGQIYEILKATPCK